MRCGRAAAFDRSGAGRRRARGPGALPSALHGRRLRPRSGACALAASGRRSGGRVRRVVTGPRRRPFARAAANGAGFRMIGMRRATGLARRAELRDEPLAGCDAGTARSRRGRRHSDDDALQQQNESERCDGKRVQDRPEPRAPRLAFESPPPHRLASLPSILSTVERLPIMSLSKSGRCHLQPDCGFTATIGPCYVSWRVRRRRLTTANWSGVQ